MIVQALDFKQYLYHQKNSHTKKLENVRMRIELPFFKS